MSEMNFSGVFWKIYGAAKTQPRYISNRGGTRSGKTYSILQFLHVLIPNSDRPGDVSSVVSETLPHLKRGAIRDFERIVGHSLKDDQHWNATDYIYTYDNGGKLEFFSADSGDKVMGPARKRLFVNEANHIGFDTFRQLAVRTTGLILIDYNPAAAFWAMDKIETKPNCVTIHSTYRDNDFLTPEQVAEIESYRNDAAWWRVYGEGLVGMLDGAIYDFEQVGSIPTDRSFAEVYGLDFGFTNDPTAVVHIYADTGRRELWVDEVCYRTRMRNADIVEALRAAGVPYRSIPIYADCAEPKSIADIADAGFNVKPCTKDAPVRSEKMKFQIDFVKGWKLYVTKSSVNIIKELRNYVWSKDKDGIALNVPIDKFNHALDAMRYAVYTHFAQRAGAGQYNFTIR